jgi:nucleoside-diphosphate-sugar epimerase
MTGLVLLTDGVGFIATHRARALILEGARFGYSTARSLRRIGGSPIQGMCELGQGDVADRDLVFHSLDDVVTVAHVASLVGVG